MFSNAIKEYDGETGLYYLNSRYYDSKIARFLSEDTYTGDPNDPLSLNLYSYCYNNPIAYTDPTGHYVYLDWDENGNPYQRESDIIVDATHPYVDTGTPNDGIFVYTNTNYINASNSAGVVNNSTIGEIYTSTGSNSTIYNYGTIETIRTGESSTTTINNSGDINKIITGAKSTNTIKNDGVIETIKNGGRTRTTIENNVFLGAAERGPGFSKMFVNGTNLKKYEATFEDYFNLWGDSIGRNMEQFGQNITDFCGRMSSDDPRIRSAFDNEIDSFLKGLDNASMSILFDTPNVIMNAGESFDSWFAKYENASPTQRTKMLADVSAETIRDLPLYVASDGTIRILKSGKYVEGTLNSIPRGFSNASQVQQCTVELEQALAKSGLDAKSIQVRGSAATGVSSKGGGFRMEAQNGLKPSDVDVGIEFNNPVSNITTSKNQPGFIHPDKMMKNFPELKAWSEKWSNILGRDITPGGWQPGTLPSDPSNIHLK